MKRAIAEIARDNYLDEVRFIDADPLPDEILGRPELFIGRQPRDIMASAKTVILVTIYIGKYQSPADTEYGRLSRLVLAGFYSNIVKPITAIAEYLKNQGYEAKVINEATDQTSIPIKGAAVKAGLGWIGKNTLLVSERYGSFRALGVILTNADLAEQYAPAVNRCGKCSNCVDSCPTRAIRQDPRELIRPRCLSYLFGVDSSEWPFAQVDSQGYFFECEICQNICPWNQRHLTNPLETPFVQLFDREKIRPLLKRDALLRMDEDTYRKELVPHMGGSNIPYPIFRRNVLMLKVF